LENNLLLDVETYAVNFITRNVSKDFAFHDLQHTISVVEAADKIGKAMNLSEESLEILQIAAWFHDMGYDKGREGHEERGCEYAANFLQPFDYPADKLEKIQNCIRATHLNHPAETELEKIICDADLSHLGRRNYWDRCDRIRQELAVTRDNVMTDEEWVSFELGFMQAHSFNTPIAQELYGNRKVKHIQKLERRQKRYKALSNPDGSTALPVRSKKGKKKKKPSYADLASRDSSDNINLKEINLGRGVETMYRTRPKITEGRFTRKNIEERNANLLFFGNFYNMSLDDYNWGMLEMIKDEDFLYSSMTRDLYYLGIVLAKKYRYLSYCYTVFMYGLIISVITFAIVFIA